MGNKYKLNNQSSGNIISRRKFIGGTMAAFAGISIGRLGLGRAAFAASLSGGRKALVVFYSWSGNTKQLAGQIGSLTGADMLELQTAHAYPTEYRATTEQAKRELAEGHLPELSTKIDNLADYEVVFLGSPSWWGTYAPAVRTFLTDYDLAGKTLVPFITHEGSGLGRAVDDLRQFCPSSTILDGLAVRGGRVASSGNDVAAWLRRLSLVE